jgi:hypothetical protein
MPQYLIMSALFACMLRYNNICIYILYGICCTLSGVKEKKLSKSIMWPADQMLYFLR